MGIGGRGALGRRTPDPIRAVLEADRGGQAGEMTTDRTSYISAEAAAPTRTCPLSPVPHPVQGDEKLGSERARRALGAARTFEPASNVNAHRGPYQVL